MERRQRPWWHWALAGLVGLVTLLLVWKLPSWLYGDVSNASVDARLQAASGFRTALVAGLAGLAALGSLAMATRTYRLTQQGQITERYTKAIEQLGSDKLDVRLGGIYALERIARDSKQDQPTVVEVLSAFVREHSNPAHTDSEPSIAKVLSTFLQANSEAQAERQADAEQPTRKRGPTTDVRAALTVLDRLPSLPDPDVTRADLSKVQFGDAQLRWAKLRDFRLTWANLAGADLRDSILGKTNLWRANLKGADLERANLKEANLQGANLHGAILRDSKLQGATCDAQTVWPDGFDWKAAGVILVTPPRGLEAARD